MADYVHRNILCQAYVHVDVFEDFDECVALLEKNAVPIVQERASFFLYEGAGVDLTSDEGSVKSRITIFGTLILALQGIKDYKDFREGVTLLASDVERVAQVAVTETLFALKARNNDIVRIEVRLGVVGQLRRTISEIDRIKEENGLVLSRTQVQRLDILRDDIERVLDNLKDADDVRLVSGELYALVERLPESPLPGPKEKLDQVAIIPYRQRKAALLDSLRKRRAPVPVPLI